MRVFPSPESAGCSRYVSFEFRKGIWESVRRSVGRRRRRIAEERKIRQRCGVVWHGRNGGAVRCGVTEKER